jgi:hypothetical protein
LDFSDCCGDTIGFETDNSVESRRGSGSSMESPKWEQISYFEAGVLIVDQVKPAILKRTAVRLNLSKNEGIK